jgi:hypothetical protein
VPEPELFPSRDEAPGEFAIRAARCFDIPFFLQLLVLLLVLHAGSLVRHG